MTWETIAGLITLCGFIITIIKTVIPLTNAITLLTEKTEEISDKIEEIDARKTRAHKELWAHNKTQDDIIKAHEIRLHDLDGK